MSGVEDWIRAEGRMGEKVSVSPSPGVDVAGCCMVDTSLSGSRMCEV